MRALVHKSMDLIRQQFQAHRCDKIFSKLVGPDLKSYWPNRPREIINMTSSLYSSEIPLRQVNKLGSQFSMIARQLPMTTKEIFRESMIEWRSRRGGNKKK